MNGCLKFVWTGILNQFGIFLGGGDFQCRKTNIPTVWTCWYVPLIHPFPKTLIFPSSCRKGVFLCGLRTPILENKPSRTKWVDNFQCLYQKGTAFKIHEYKSTFTLCYINYTSQELHLKQYKFHLHEGRLIYLVKYSYSVQLCHQFLLQRSQSNKPEEHQDKKSKNFSSSF